MFYMKSQGGTDYPLHPFTDPVMDFVLQLNKKTKESSKSVIITIVTLCSVRFADCSD